MFKIVFAVAFFILVHVPALGQSDEIQQAFERGNSHFQQGRYEMAIFEYRSILGWPSEHQARAHFNIGICRFRQGRFQEAVDAYKPAIGLRQGNYPAAAYALGLAYRSMKNFQQAREAFALAAKGQHMEATFELALESQRAGDLDAATEQYRKALRQSKGRHPASHNNLGVIFAIHGEIDKAMQEFESALQQARGRFPVAAENLAQCNKIRDGDAGRVIAQLKPVENTRGERLRIE